MKKIGVFLVPIFFLFSCSISDNVIPEFEYEPFDDPAKGKFTAMVDGKSFENATEGGLAIVPVENSMWLYIQDKNGAGFEMRIPVEDMTTNKNYDLEQKNEYLMIRYFPPASKDLKENIAAIIGFASISGFIRFTDLVPGKSYKGTFEFVGRNYGVEPIEYVKSYTVTQGTFEIYK